MSKNFKINFEFGNILKATKKKQNAIPVAGSEILFEDFEKKLKQCHKLFIKVMRNIEHHLKNNVVKCTKFAMHIC